MKKNQLIAGIAVMVVVFACKNSSISENERKGVKEVVALYGGQVQVSEQDSATPAGNKNIVQVQLSQSTFAENYTDMAMPELPASGVAYAFYKRLGNEKKKYTHVKTQLLLKNGDKEEYEFPVNELELVNSKIAIVQRIGDLIKQRNYEELKPMLDSTYGGYNKEQFIENLEETDSRLGKANELVIVGFSFYKLSGKDILHISGQMMRGATANALSVDIDPNDRQERAIMINYKI
jgi:hypothetical protein